MKDFIKHKLSEALIREKLMLKDWDLYIKLVADAYADAPEFDSSVVGSWKALNDSNYVLFNRILSKINLIFITENKSNVGSVEINGKSFEVKLAGEGDEYNTQSEMKNSFEETGILKINMDHSEHPILSTIDNIVFRTVHDYIAHILGNHDFGAKGEIACYNLHAKMAPNAAIPALFTEVVGQASTTIVTKSYPKQKIALLKGFDYNRVGVIDDENYTIVDKVLIPKSEVGKPMQVKRKDRSEPEVIPQNKVEPVEEPELEPEINEYYDDFDMGFDDSDFYEPKKVKNTKASFLSKFPDVLRLYRVLIADSIDNIDVKYPGQHYSMDKNNLLKTHSFLKGKNYFLMTVDAPKSLIDVKTTMDNNELYPNEKEITLKNKGRGVDVVSIHPLK